MSLQIPLPISSPFKAVDPASPLNGSSLGQVDPDPFLFHVYIPVSVFFNPRVTFVLRGISNLGFIESIALLLEEGKVYSHPWPCFLYIISSAIRKGGQESGFGYLP